MCVYTYSYIARCPACNITITIALYTCMCNRAIATMYDYIAILYPDSNNTFNRQLASQLTSYILYTRMARVNYIAAFIPNIVYYGTLLSAMLCLLLTGASYTRTFVLFTPV